MTDAKASEFPPGNQSDSAPDHQAAAGQIAVVTGASTGIGYELARCCAENGFNLVIAADEPKIQQAAETFRATGVNVDSVEADLATAEGVDKLYAALNGRPVDVVIANAG